MRIILADSRWLKNQKDGETTGAVGLNSPTAKGVFAKRSHHYMKKPPAQCRRLEARSQKSG
jgi:hypothetical protein